MDERLIYCPRTNCRHCLRCLANKGGKVGGWTWACQKNEVVMKLNQYGRAICDSYEEREGEFEDDHRQG